MNRLTKVFAASFLLTGSIALTGCNTLSPTLSPKSEVDENAKPPVVAIPGVKTVQPQNPDAADDTPTNADFDPDALQNLPEGTDIVIRPGKERTIQEYRVNGVLYSIKVIPKVGKPYYLVAVDRNGNFIRSNRPQMLIPGWRIFEW